MKASAQNAWPFESDTEHVGEGTFLPTLDEQNIKSWLIGIRRPKSPRRFTEGARYRGRIVDLTMSEHARDRDLEPGFSVKIRVRVRSLLDGELETEPEGHEMLERLDFGPKLQPLDDFTRAVITPLVGQPLINLVGQWAEFTPGKSNSESEYQRITSWLPIPAPFDHTLPPAGPCFKLIKGGYLLRYPADGPELVPFHDLECLRYCHHVLAASGCTVSPDDMIRRVDPGRPLDKNSVQAAISSGELTSCGFFSEGLLEDEVIDAMTERVIRLTYEAVAARKCSEDAVAAKAEKIADDLIVNLSKQLKKSAANSFKLIVQHLKSDDFSAADAEAQKFRRMKNRARSCTVGGLSRSYRGSVYNVMKHAYVVIKQRGLPALAEHLKKSIRTRDGGFRYEPGNDAPCWMLW